MNCGSFSCCFSQVHAGIHFHFFDIFFLESPIAELTTGRRHFSPDDNELCCKQRLDELKTASKSTFFYSILKVLDFKKS